MERGTEVFNTIDGEAIVSDMSDEISVLHIEDDPSFADLVATFLERERDYFTIESENDPQNGLKRIEEADVDCIVCDYDMPGLNGLEVLGEVREEYPNLPFILFTGKGSEEIASEAISRGVTEYPQKGSGTGQYEVLANRIEQGVARSRAEQQVARGFQAIESSHDGISILNDDGRFIFVNESYAEATGYDREELLGKQWKILYRDEDVEEVYDEILPRARKSGWNGQSVFVRKNGEQITVDHRLTISKDSLICVIDDVTENKKIREKLSLREKAMNKAPLGIIMTDHGQSSNPIIYANDKFCELTGYSREEILGRNCRFLQGDETQEEPVTKLRQAVDNVEPVTVELRNYRRNDEMFWNRVTIAPIKHKSDNRDYFVGFQEEITE